MKRIPDPARFIGETGSRTTASPPARRASAAGCTRAAGKLLYDATWSSSYVAEPRVVHVGHEAEAEGQTEAASSADHHRGGQADHDRRRRADRASDHDRGGAAASTARRAHGTSRRAWRNAVCVAQPRCSPRGRRPQSRPYSCAYERSLRPCLGTTSTPGRRAAFHQALLGLRQGDRLDQEGRHARRPERRRVDAGVARPAVGDQDAVALHGVLEAKAGSAHVEAACADLEPVRRSAQGCGSGRWPRRWSRRRPPPAAPDSRRWKRAR